MKKGRKFSEGLLDDDKILANLNIRAGQTILDAGCGNGYMALKFSQLVGNSGKVYAFDIDEGFIANFKKEVENSNIVALVADITQPTMLQSSSIDLAYLSTVFHIFSDARIDGFVKGMKRVLKPGALLAVVNMNKEDTPFGPPVEMRSSPEELTQRLPFAPRRLIAVGEHFYMQVFENACSERN